MPFLTTTMMWRTSLAPGMENRVTTTTAAPFKPPAERSPVREKFPETWIWSEIGIRLVRFRKALFCEIGIFLGLRFVASSRAFVFDDFVITLFLHFEFSEFCF